MYYILDCEIPENENGEALMKIHNSFKIGGVRRIWRDGKEFKLEKSDIPQPIMIDFDTFRGYKGPPIELEDLGIPLMSVRLAETLTEAGVDNIYFYKAILKDTTTGEEYDYRAYKLIGRVAAVDLGKSNWKSYDNQPVSDTSFKSLALDADKAEASVLLMFRLEENINAWMIHEKVRDHLVAKSFDTLKFIKPEIGCICNQK